jgi:hypothetical protein
MSILEIVNELHRLAICLCSGMFDEHAVAAKLREIAKTLKDHQPTNQKK